MIEEEIKQPSIKLPKLRRGITLHFSDYDLDGKPQWLIHDSGRNKFFVIGWSEYECLKRWDIGEAEQLINAVNMETTLHVDLTDIEHLLQFLSYHYLIIQKGHKIYRQAKEQKLFKDENILHAVISYYLFFKIPLWHPNHFLEHTHKIANWIFSRYTLYMMMILLAIALYQLSFQWDNFIHTFPSIISWQGFISYVIAFLFCKFCHELGHAYMCKHYGVPVPTLGVAFLVFWPVLYTDTTLSYKLSNKKRLRIALAGMWIETYVTIFALLIWLNTDDLTLKTICYVTVAINWTASLLINVSPFMRFDGYYVLADLLKIPNLQFRAFSLTRWQIRRWLFDWPDPPPEYFSPRMHRILIIYSLFTWTYRLILYFGIALLVYHFFFKLLGIILFAIELFYFILAPFVAEFRNWIALRDRFKLNFRTQMTIFISFLGLALFFLPISTTIDLPATLRYSHVFLFAKQEGILLNKLPPPGTSIKENQVIAKIISPDINYLLKNVNLSYKKSLSELRRAEINPDYSHQQNILLSDIAKEQAQNIQLLKQRETLTITAPFNGIIIDTAEDLNVGTIVMKDEWLADVIDTSQAFVEAFVEQIDRNKIKEGLKGYFYPNDLSQSPTAVIVTTVETLNAKKLDCYYSSELKQNIKQNVVVDTPCYEVSELGGNIAAYLTDEGNYVPVESVYRVILKTTGIPTLHYIERGSVILHTEAHSYAYKVFYFLNKVIIGESEL
jgi:putative peptide zinc metalloprotease protein